MTKSKSIRVIPWLVIAAAVLCSFVISVMVNDRANNPIIDGRRVDAWIVEAQTSGYNERADVARRLAQHPERAVPSLAYYLDRTPHPIHVAGVKLWSQFVSKSANVLDYSATRVSAAQLIEPMGTNAVGAVPALMNAAVDSQWAVSEAARGTLYKLSRVTAPIMADRLGRWVSVENQLKWVDIIDSMGGGAKHAVPELVSAFDRSPPQVQAKILGIFEQPAFHVGQVADVVVDAATEGDVLVRCAALTALGKYKKVSERAKGVISENLKHGEFSVRFHAAYARCELEERPEEVVLIIGEGLNYPEHRVWAVAILGNLGKVAEPAIPALIQALVEERNPRPLRNPPAAGVALSRIGTHALPALVELLAREDHPTQLNAVVTLGVFGERAYVTAEPLLTLLNHESDEVRQATALTLASIGYHTYESVPVLRVLAKDDDPFTASWANDALLKIDPALLRQREGQ